MILRVPGSIWYDALDPAATAVPRESGWPDPDRFVRRGFGYTATYDDLDPAVARAIVEWVRERAETLSFGVDPEQAAASRRALRWAAGITFPDACDVPGLYCPEHDAVDYPGGAR